nr:MAG TPA: hypothetical protein [Caudoviricetes sp.]
MLRYKMSYKFNVAYTALMLSFTQILNRLY